MGKVIWYLVSCDVSWRQGGGGFVYFVLVPTNSSASFILCVYAMLTSAFTTFTFNFLKIIKNKLLYNFTLHSTPCFILIIYLNIIYIYDKNKYLH